MKNNKITPLGMFDVLQGEAALKRCVREKLRDAFMARGYLEVITPTLEFYDVFLASELPQQSMYKLFDRQGNILALRPDVTAPLIRVAATKLDPSHMPFRMWYDQQVFRQNKTLNAKRDEITQCGVELVGADGIRADVEIIVTAIEAMRALGVDDFKIELGHIGYFKALAGCAFESPEHQDKARLLVERKDFAALSDLVERCAVGDRRAMRKLPTLFGGAEVLMEAMELSPNTSARDVIGYLREVCESVEKLGFGKYLCVDLGLVQSIDYYTGLVFKGYLEGFGDVVLSGGRYNSLSASFDKKLCSTGFAVYVDSIIATKRAALSRKRRRIVIHCHALGDLKRGEEELKRLRTEGFDAEMSVFDSLSDAIKCIPSGGVEQVIFVSGDTVETYGEGGVRL